MSVYHTSFTYLGKNSRDMDWIITHFADNADTGETDTFLSTSAIYSESYDGTRRQLHGVKYDSVVESQITVIKQDGTDFGIQDNREALRWLTGSKQATWLDLYIDDEVKYRLLGRVSNVSQYKLDARVVGLIITFESVSPYGYSSLQSRSSILVNGSATVKIDCDSDDLYAYVPINIQFKNTTSNGKLTIVNDRIPNESSNISKSLAINETITLSDNMMITSDKKEKTFGNTFNYVFPRLVPGTNTLTIEGAGILSYQYIAPVKLGNIAIDLNSISDPICNEQGDIILDTLDWKRVSNTPSTLRGYGITDAYTATEIDNKFENFTPTTNMEINKAELDAMLAEVLGE